MPHSLCKEELREGLCVYRFGEPDRPGTVVSWCLGSCAEDTTVTVGWPGGSSKTTQLSRLQHFGRFVSDLHAQSERYDRLLDELRRAGGTCASGANDRHDCLTCAHKHLDIGSTPCLACKPVTGGAVNWTRRASPTVEG